MNVGILNCLMFEAFEHLCKASKANFCRIKTYKAKGGKITLLVFKALIANLKGKTQMKKILCI